MPSIEALVLLALFQCLVELSDMHERANVCGSSLVFDMVCSILVNVRIDIGGCASRCVVEQQLLLHFR
jgi:hypothetical protein